MVLMKKIKKFWLLVNWEYVMKFTGNLHGETLDFQEWINWEYRLWCTTTFATTHARAGTCRRTGDARTDAPADAYVDAWVTHGPMQVPTHAPTYVPTHGRRTGACRLREQKRRKEWFEMGHWHGEEWHNWRINENDTHLSRDSHDPHDDLNRQEPSVSDSKD